MKKHLCPIPQHIKAYLLVTGAISIAPKIGESGNSSKLLSRISKKNHCSKGKKQTKKHQNWKTSENCCMSLSSLVQLQECVSDTVLFSTRVCAVLTTHSRGGKDASG